MKTQHPRSSRPNKRALKVACTVSAAALMLGVSHAATVGFNFQVNYCSAASYAGAPVTAPAFGIDVTSWESLTQMDTGYGCSADYYTLNQVIDGTSSDVGLHPLPLGSLNITWSAYTANASGFGGYDRSPPHYTYGGNGHRPGEEEVYWGFLRDGVNFGPGSTGGDNNQPGYNIDIVGLKSLFPNSPYVVELIASGDSIAALTNAFVIDAGASITNSVSYPNIPTPGVNGDTAWPRGVGGGLSTVSAPVNGDHLIIAGNRAQHAGPDGDTPGFNNASTIAGFIITDKPVVTMPPQSVLAVPGDDVTLRAIAIGVPPLSLQWRKDGVAIPGATSATYALSKITNLLQGGSYDLLVTNLYGSTTSKVSVVTVDKLDMAPQPFVVDSKPSGIKVDGELFGTTRLLSSQDSVGTNRTGVLQFSSASRSQIEIPVDSPDLNTAEGTISFWMRSSGTNTTAGNEGAMLFDRRTGSGLVIVQHDDGSLFVQTAPKAVNEVSSSGTVSDGRWHHVAVTYDQSDGGLISIYIDGKPNNSNPNTGTWSWPATQEIEYGLSDDTYWRPYNGLLDDLRVYNRALTDAEVASIAASDALVDPTALALRLNFDAPAIAGVRVGWKSSDAVLQSSSIVTGPYTDVPDATSPFVIEAGAGNVFYRYTHIPVSIQSNPYDM
ncbi:MAG: hypothetical protein JWM99_3212 [Verrucomicrobiales bacterium]|nr:hypothetical protein [Verrucomicrobiales bacterium]